MNKYKALFSDTLIFGIGNFVTKLIYFFLMPIYTLALTPKEFGIADLLNNSLQLLMPVLTLSISDAVFRFLLDKDCVPKILLNGGLKILVYSYILVGIATVIVYSVDTNSYWCFFTLLYITESTRMLLAQFVRGLGYVKTFAINGILGAIFLLGCSYLFLQVNCWGIDGYLLSFIIANIVSIIYLLWKVNIIRYIDFSSKDNILLKSMLIYSLPLIPNMLSWWLTNISSRYIIAGYCGLSIAGLFAGASKIPALINVIASVFQQAWQFASVKEYQESAKSEFYSRVFHYYSLFVIVSSSLVLMALPYLSHFILKGEFYNAWIYTPLLLFSATLGCYSIFFGTFYTVVKDNKRVMYTTLIGAVVNVSLCLILIPFISVWGALVANVVSYAVIVLLRIRDTKKYVTLIIHAKIGVSLLLLLIQSFVTVEYPIIATFISFMILLFHINDVLAICRMVKQKLMR